MRKLILSVALGIILIPSVGTAKLADIPMELRTPNWDRMVCRQFFFFRRCWGVGSCVYSATANVLDWQGRHDDAEWIRQNFSGGAWFSGLRPHLDNRDLRYSWTLNGDVEWLQMAMDNQLAAAMYFKEQHACVLLDLTDTYAVVLDVNDTSSYEIWTREAFIEEWQKRGGVAWTFLYGPAYAKKGTNRPVAGVEVKEKKEHKPIHLLPWRRPNPEPVVPDINIYNGTEVPRVEEPQPRPTPEPIEEEGIPILPFILAPLIGSGLGIRSGLKGE